MTLLIDRHQLELRREAMAGSLGALSRSLAHDLEPVLDRDLFIPPDKARLTRRGGRCEVDGTLLEFDPFSPRVHRCPRCLETFDDDAHYRWWVMWYQLWLAERSVHAATLFALEGDPRHRDFARAVLDGYAERYLEYPNVDNVLGPTRVFFSTYLESIWLLQLIVALDLLEMSTPTEWHAAVAGRVRARVIEPSAALIGEYDEGMSNRQVWNNAALLAASRSLGRTVDGPALRGPSGLVAHLTSGLLSDGTWYEGENYHLFAHRGLWYGVTLATAAGVVLDPALVARFDEAFATPFMTALPDFTFPSRRDSQYAVSLRQWRFADLAELGLARQPGDTRLVGALATLYDGSVERHATDRDRSTAEAERNTPPTSLDRSDLGWRSLLFALPALPALQDSARASVLMAGQGLAILRREGGNLYAALDYGHSGAGHGHPDRLNLILARGHDRWLDDVGTGSYVDPSLHWYRSTLAHNAPLVDGRSQQRVHGTLVAYDDRGAAGWVRATVDGVARGVTFTRTLVAMTTYVIDVLEWTADREVQVDLPFHVDGDLEGVGSWVPAVPTGGADPEDGFSFLRESAVATQASGLVDARFSVPGAEAAVFVETPHEWWRATSYGPPGSGARRFYFVRASGRAGKITSVWDVAASIRLLERRETMTVTLRDGTIHEHSERSDGPDRWHVALSTPDARSSIDLAGAVTQRSGTPLNADTVQYDRVRDPIVVRRNGERVAFDLAAADYRRSEVTWSLAGKPSATVGVQVQNDALVIHVRVTKRDVAFAPSRESNPLDNEPADINSDGVQLHFVLDSSLPGRSTELTYILVPEIGRQHVRVTSRASGDAAPSPRSSWVDEPDGYAIQTTFALADLGLSPRSRFLLGVVVNDMAPGRERRRGQLVLGGSGGEFVYLRGDRLAADRHLPFLFVDA